MNTREWLKHLVGSYVPYDQHNEGRLFALIAHLDRVGWPEEPKVCETCPERQMRSRAWDGRSGPHAYCAVAHTWCENVGGGCLAWRKRDA